MNKRASDDELFAKYMGMIMEESSEPLRQWWLSFADPDMPEGQQFLGAVVVEGRGRATARLEASMRGLNLGGEIMSIEVPLDKRIPHEWCYRVMNKDEACNCPVEITEENERNRR